MFPKKVKDSFRQTETWVIFFLAGIVTMNYPFVTIFDKPLIVAGVPLLFLYLSGGWLISIFVIALFVASIPRSDDQREKGNR